VIEVVARMKQVGLGVGQTALVDETLDVIKKRLRAGMIVPTGRDVPLPEPKKKPKR
jgi:hypothetical protein